MSLVRQSFKTRCTPQHTIRSARETHRHGPMASTHFHFAHRIKVNCTERNRFMMNNNHVGHYCMSFRLVEKIAKYQSAGKVHSVHKHYCSLCQINHRTRLDSHSYLLMHTTISISVTTGPLGHNLFTDCSPRMLFVLSLWSVTGYALQRLCSSLFITRTCDFEVFTRGYVPQQNA